MISSEIRLSHLHWSSPLFDVLSHIRQLVVPVILAIFGATRGNASWLIIASLFLIPSIVTSLFRYFTLRYSIRDRQLVINQGMVFRRVRTVPVERIQNVDFVQNLIHRMLNVAEVRVETAGGSGPEATLRVLSMDQIDRLRAEIFDLKHAQATELAMASPITGMPDTSPIADTGGLAEHAPFEAAVRSSAQPDSGISLLTIPVSWLVKAGIADNRGLLMFGVAVGLLSQFDIHERINAKWLKSLIGAGADTDRWQLVILGVVGTLGLLLLLRIASVMWYVVRFFDYQLVRRGEDLQVSCGLFTRVSATVPRRRIQLISVHRNWLMRLLNLSSIRIETAGAGRGGQGNESAKVSVSGRWFIPIVPNDRVPELMQELRPELLWNENQFAFHSLAPRASTRRMRLAIAVSAIAMLIGLVFYRPWGSLPGAILLPLLVTHAYFDTRFTRYARTDDGVIFRSGVLTQKTSITFFEKIQVVTTLQSPFDRRWRMIQLAIDTASAGEANHRITIPMLDQTFGLVEKTRITNQAALHQPVFR